jgi:hypothetical protein
VQAMTSRFKTVSHDMDILGWGIIDEDMTPAISDFFRAKLPPSVKSMADFLYVLSIDVLMSGTVR